MIAACALRRICLLCVCLLDKAALAALCCQQLIFGRGYIASAFARAKAVRFTRDDMFSLRSCDYMYFGTLRVVEAGRCVDINQTTELRGAETRVTSCRP